jgi:hypothetical protein
MASQKQVRSTNYSTAHWIALAMAIGGVGTNLAAILLASDLVLNCKGSAISALT